MNTIETAIGLFRQGRPREAEAVCEQRLTVAPDDVETLALLAEILLASGANHRAVVVLGRLIEREPRNAAARRRLGGALLALGRDAEAAAALREAIHIEPGSSRAHNNLGQALLRLERIPEAIACLEEALRLDAGYAIAHHNLGLAYATSGHAALAVECVRRAMALDPSWVSAEVNLAAVFDGCDQPTEALAAYDRALAQAPALVDAWLGRGVVLAKLNRLDLALQSFARALDLKPGDSVTMTQQAAVLLSMEHAAESLAAADAALQVDAQLPQAHNARAGALRRLGRRAEAVRALERALTLDPEYVEAWGNLGTVLYEMGCFEEAVAACRRALALDPTGIQVRTRLLARLIPSVPGSAQEVTLARNTFDVQLAELEAWLDSRPLSERDALTAAQQQLFYLSYEERSNRSVLQKYRGACAARLTAFAGLSAARPRILGDAATERFKLGFVSAHVHDHSVYHAILRGWLQHLSRERFEVALFSIGARKDACTEAAITCVEHFDTGARGIAEWARAIGDRQLDAIIFPEIGMNETTLALASLRLARRQFVAWGHPETSGLPTLDGYLSADLFEPPNARDQYSEPLVRLPNLGVHCQPYAVESTQVDLESLGVVRDGPVFLCPGAPFKYRPQDDWVLVDIARQLGRCTFVFFQYESGELSRKLAARMAAAFTLADLDPRVYLRSIPWQPRAAFFGLLRQADVYLDTIGFSGFNTLMQAMQCQLPCVTVEGRFLRGRLGSGILRRLGIPQCIAHDSRGYVDLAVQLAGDAGYRAEIRAAIRRAEHRLYADSSAVDALSAFLLESRDS